MLRFYDKLEIWGIFIKIEGLEGMEFCNSRMVEKLWDSIGREWDWEFNRK